MDDILSKVAEIIVYHLSGHLADVKMDSSLVNDLGADDLDSIEIIMSLEEEYDIEIPDDISEGFKTVGDIVDYLRSIQGEE
jgi:acyl carrier protein